MEEDLIWTWDPEYASDNCKVMGYGMLVAMMPEDEQQDQAKWQKKTNRSVMVGVGLEVEGGVRG